LRRAIHFILHSVIYSAKRIKFQLLKELKMPRPANLSKLSVDALLKMRNDIAAVLSSKRFF